MSAAELAENLPDNFQWGKTLGEAKIKCSRQIFIWRRCWTLVFAPFPRFSKSCSNPIVFSFLKSHGCFDKCCITIDRVLHLAPCNIQRDKASEGVPVNKTLSNLSFWFIHCTMRTLYTVQYLFIATKQAGTYLVSFNIYLSRACSVARNIEKIWFLWASNSK